MPEASIRVRLGENLHIVGGFSLDVDGTKIKFITIALDRNPAKIGPKPPKSWLGFWPLPPSSLMAQISPMNLILASAEDCTPYREVVLEQYPTTIGRGAEADVLINDRWASRIHCRIDRTEDGLVISDLNSKHGTFINGKPISQSKIQPGDRISLGLTVFVAHMDSATVKSY